MIYTTGDMRQVMSEDLIHRVEQVVNSNQHRKEPYYLLCYTRKLGYEIHTKIVIMDRQNFMRDNNGRVIPLLGTILFKVDNKRGLVDIVWALPKDIPETQHIYGDVIDEVARQAMAFNVPVVNA